jgi:hypothetical protein
MSCSVDLTSDVDEWGNGQSELCIQVDFKGSDLTKRIGLSTHYEWIDLKGEDFLDFDLNVEAEWQKIVSSGQPWTDPSFPPSKESVDGPKQEVSESAETANVAMSLNCRYGVAAKQATVHRDSPNKGRLYFHCASRQCGFFAWADGRPGLRSELIWRRFSTSVVVTDFGFSAKDLCQGDVGDCWFLSALACVAERHDLISKLFVDTTISKFGVHVKPPNII